MNAIRVKALHNDLGLVREGLDSFVIDHDVSGRDGLALVKLPDMQLVDRVYTGNL